MQESLKRTVERRRHPRYRVKEDAVAFYGGWPCAIVDISEVGIAVSCANPEQEPVEADHLDLFLADADFYLPQLAVRLVTAQPALPRSMFSLLRFKRIGLKFSHLSTQQQARSKEFIRCCSASTE